MEIKVRVAEERDVERVAMLYEKLHDYLETHENHPRWKRGIYPTKSNAEEGFQKTGESVFIGQKSDRSHQRKRWSRQIHGYGIPCKNDD